MCNQLVMEEGRVGRERNPYGPAESPAIRRIFGMSSNVPGSEGLTTSCSLRAWRRLLETEVMLGFLRALRCCWSSSDGITVDAGEGWRGVGTVFEFGRAEDALGAKALGWHCSP